MSDKELYEAMCKLLEIPWWELSDNAASKAVRSWGHAGAMMEKATDASRTGDEFYQILLGRGGDGFFCDFPDTFPDLGICAHDKSLPRAINEACVVALS